MLPQSRRGRVGRKRYPVARRGDNKIVKLRLILEPSLQTIERVSSPFGPDGQEIATMRMRILKKHGTGIPDAVLACLAEFAIGSYALGILRLISNHLLWRTKLWL